MSVTNVVLFVLLVLWVAFACALVWFLLGAASVYGAVMKAIRAHQASPGNLADDVALYKAAGVEHPPQPDTSPFLRSERQRFH